MGAAGYDEVVLLTGYPSFAARKMAEELLRDRGTYVHAVVHPKLEADARAALDLLPLGDRQRLNVIEGDAAAMDLGLSGVELAAIAREVTRIHHCAQASFIGVARENAEAVNVAGAREILEVAEVCEKLECLVYHSTASVAGNRTGLVREDELDKGQSFRNDVEETRAHGERIVRGAMGKLPICVVRPSMIVGDSTTGEVDRFDGPYLLMLLIVTSPPDMPLPLPGRGDAPLNMVPIDYVVRAARAIGRDRSAIGRTFHVVDPTPLPARRVFELVARAGGRRMARGFIPANLTKALLRTPGIERFAKSPRAFLEALGTDVTYSAANTSEVLASTGIRCPPFESYVERLVDYVQVRLRDLRAKREAAASEPEDPLG